MKYPTTVERFSKAYESCGGKISKDEKPFFEKIVAVLNETYTQGFEDGVEAYNSVVNS